MLRIRESGAYGGPNTTGTHPERRGGAAGRINKIIPLDRTRWKDAAEKNIISLSHRKRNG